MQTVFVALGANLGDRLAALQAAASALMGLLTELRSSAVYESAAAYVEDQPPFLNAVVCGTTTLEPLALLAQLQALEQHAGRLRTQRFGARPLDLDLLLYGSLQLATPTLTLPHPRMAERDFVLRPLADLAPQLVLPGATEPVAVLAQRAAIGPVLAQVAPTLLPLAQGESAPPAGDG